MAIHQVSKRDWPKLTWKYPRIHNFDFGFGLDANDAAATKNSTMVTWLAQNNAIVDYETIKTNPENADFAVVNYPDTCAGSYIPKIQVFWTANLRPGDTELVHLRFDTLSIHTSMLNRLDAFDKKTGFDIETILELEHATDDEMCYPIFNGVKLYELGSTAPALDTTFLGGFADVGLGSNLQPEGIAFDKEQYFDAMHYFTNKEMLKTVTGRMRTHIVSEPLVPHGKSIVMGGGTLATPSLCKFQHPYTYCGEIFSVPQVGSKSQYHLAEDTVTAAEHLTVRGFVRFMEFNPDFNFSRA